MDDASGSEQDPDGCDLLDSLRTLVANTDKAFLTHIARFMSVCRYFGSAESCPMFDRPTHPCESGYWEHLGELIHFAEHAFLAEERLIDPLRLGASRAVWELQVAEHARFMATLGDFVNQGSHQTVCLQIQALVSRTEQFCLAHRLEHDHFAREVSVGCSPTRTSPARALHPNERAFGNPVVQRPLATDQSPHCPC